MLESSSDEDVPLSKRLATQQVMIVATADPGQADISGTGFAGRPRVDPKPSAVAGKKRSHTGGSGGPSGGPIGGPSARAARLGSGSSFALEAATGDFSAGYATVGVLGRGSFTEVNLLRHRESGGLFVLKTCCKLDALSYAHLRAEAAAMRGVNHPLLVAPVAISSPPGRSANYSLLLPLCPGGDLLQLLRRQPDHKLPSDEARLYCGMVILGLCALHEHGFAYRDLKPDNLLLRADGYIALSDFGFAAKFKDCGKVKVGTTLYQAPEIVRKAKHGAPVDWWALGVLLVEMLTGETPFGTDIAAAHVEANGADGGADEPRGESDEAVIESNILSHTGGVPTRSAAAVPAGAPSELVAGLLTPDPVARLGSSGGATQVRSANWLLDIDWAALEAHTLPVPHIPPPVAEDVDQALVELCKRCQSGFD